MRNKIDENSHLINQDSFMLEQFSKSPSLLSVTDYEEHIWMLQLQQPEQVNRRFNLWKVNQGLDIQLLIKAIQDIIKTTPDLNVRYTFSDEGDLYKYPFDDYSACLELKKSNTEQVFEQVATARASAGSIKVTPEMLDNEAAMTPEHIFC